ncbi:MAG TPA: hypothetical protein VFP56_04250 [Candidatus Limnocylindrales bacterium]|nr:hypothetical protein [Candidatus Limnocylindrales bacterium]
MSVRTSSTRLVETVTGGQPVPWLAKVGAVVIVLGLVFDTAAHTVLHSIHDELIGSFPLGEHLSHLVVVVGMVLVLAGIVADGIRSQRRLARQEGTPRNAIR